MRKGGGAGECGRKSEGGRSGGCACTLQRPFGDLSTMSCSSAE